ncbi:MAG: hypothetical protein ABIQ99_13425 [Thermoflexales bacterium]
MTRSAAEDPESELEARETVLLRDGVPAFTPGHLYFFFGDIMDVFEARAAANTNAVCELVKVDPLNDTDEDINARPALLTVLQNGDMRYLTPEGWAPFGYGPRDFTPFGEQQMLWFSQLAEKGERSAGPS